MTFWIVDVKNAETNEKNQSFWITKTPANPFYTGRCSLLSRMFHIVIDSSSWGLPVSSNTWSSGTVESLGNVRAFKPGNHFKNLHHFFSKLSILDTFCTFLYLVLLVHEVSWFLRIDRFLWCPLISDRELSLAGRTSLLFFVSLACPLRTEFVRGVFRTLLDIGRCSGLFIGCFWLSSMEFPEPSMLSAIMPDAPLVPAILEP